MPLTDIVVAVWGDWHRNAFLRMNLPTLMTEQNLPKFASMIDSRWRFYTTAADHEIFEADPLFQEFARIVEIEWIELDKGDHPNFTDIDVHGHVWIEGMKAAREAKKFVMFMPPDVIWSDGGFGHFADLIVHQNKRAIYINWHLRAIADSFIPKFHERFGTGETPIQATARDLVRMTLDHIHPLSSSYLRDSPYFPRHSEMMFWPVPGQGLLMHVFALTPFIFDTTRFEYTDFKLITEVPDPDELHFVTDSDELFIVSLAELGKDRDWYEISRPFDFVRHGEWWSQYDSPGNNHLSVAPFRLKFAETSEDDWRKAELSARVLLRKAIATREMTRVWKKAKERGCNLTALILSHVLRNDLSHKIIGDLRDSTILMPTDEHLRSYFNGWSHYFVQPENFGDLRRLLRAHILPGDSIALGVGGSESGTSSVTNEVLASGDPAEIKMVRSARNVVINGARVISEPIELGTSTLLIVDKPAIPSSRFRGEAAQSLDTH